MDENNPLYLTQKWTAAAFKIAVQNFSKWDVQPAYKKGRNVYYYLPDVIDFRLNREQSDKPKLDLAQERAQLAKAQTERVRLDIEITKGNLLHREVIELYWSAMVENMKARILALPTKTAQVALRCKELHEIETEVKKLCYEALHEIAKSGIPADLPSLSADIGAGATAAESDSESVGRRKKTTKQRGGRRARTVVN